MMDSTVPPAMRSLLRRLPGCARWSPTALDALAATARVELLPAGRVLVRAGEPVPDWYGVIERGVVRVARATAGREETLDHLTDGDALDPGVAGDVAPCSMTVVEPTRWIRVSQSAVVGRPERAADLGAGPGGGVALWMERVGTLVTGPPVTCRAGATIGDAATIMSRQRVGSILVTDAEGAPLGIVTDRDLARRVVAVGRPATAAVAEIMSAPVATIDAQCPALEALLEMTRRNVRHLAVVHGGRLVGVVSSRDVMLLQSTHPVALVREIEDQASVDGLAGVASKIGGLVRWLMRQGVATVDLGRIVSELNDRLVRRVVALSEAGLEATGAGPPPVPYAWVVAGSEGRREQTLRTDQDNAIVYADPPAELRDAAAAYFERLGMAACEALVQVGFPRCPGDFMASNPRWRQPLAGWREHFASWMDTPLAERLLNAALFFDLRPVAGDTATGSALWDWVCARAPGCVLFQRLMAKAAVERQVPLGLFGRFVVERSGEHRDTLDIKARGVFPVAQAMRVLALALGLRETNTMDRLAGAGERGNFTAGEVAELRDAYEVVCRVRLEHQLAQLDAGEPPDNFVNPHALGKADRLLLREAFRTVAWLQRALEDRFQTALIG